ncbi:hypothetical protein ACYX34_03825 [Nitrospira sp. CMX1]|mgnify:CR=1 FL=1|nr:hypothetical protein [Nitrospira sp.]MBS0165709.1 hypothetical protein [Nitrospira sp.]
MKALDMNTQRVLDVIVGSPNSALDDIVLECPHLTWNQVFLIIDQLSREGIINLIPKVPGIYTIHLSNILEAAGHRHVGV